MHWCIHQEEANQAQPHWQCVHYYTTPCTHHKNDMPMQTNMCSYNTSLLVDAWLVTWTLEFTGSVPFDWATESETAEGPTKHQSPLFMLNLFPKVLQGSIRITSSFWSTEPTVMNTQPQLFVFILLRVTAVWKSQIQLQQGRSCQSHSNKKTFTLTEPEGMLHWFQHIYLDPPRVSNFRNFRSGNLVVFRDSNFRPLEDSASKPWEFLGFERIPWLFPYFLGIHDVSPKYPVYSGFRGSNHLLQGHLAAFGIRILAFKRAWAI